MPGSSNEGNLNIQGIVVSSGTWQTVSYIQYTGVNYFYDPSVDPLFGTKKEIQRKQGALMPKIKRTMKKDWESPETITSVFGQTFPSSKMGEWVWYEGAGWVHASEQSTFIETYRQCELLKTWHNYDNMRRCVIDGKMMILCSKARKQLELVECGHSGEMYQKKDMAEVLDRRNQKLLVHKKFVGTEYIPDGITGVPFFRGNKRKLKRGETTMVVNVFTVTNDKFIACPHCGNVFDRVMLSEVQFAPDESQPVRVHTELGPNYGGHSYCDACADEIAAKGIIREYNDKSYPKPICSSITRRRGEGEGETRKFVKKHFPQKRLFGVEAELEVKEKANLHKHALCLLKAIGQDFVIAKHDGSIKDEAGNRIGFELVTAPSDLATQRERWKAIERADNYNQLKSWDTTTCGFHVHVSREVLSSLQIGRILTFINHPANKKFVEIVAGRSEQKYTKFFPKKLADSLRPTPGGNHDEKRRVAVNLQNEKTIEFRIFRGTINYRHMIRNIEFCDAVCDYCYPAGRSLRDMASAKLFTDFVLNEHEWDAERKESRLKWPELVRWFRMHGVGVREGQKPNPAAAKALEAMAEAGESPLESIKRPSKSNHNIGILDPKSKAKPEKAEAEKVADPTF